MTGKPILSVDFDGVLHSYTSGWMGARVIPDAPVPGAIDWLIRVQRRYTVAIFSSRSRSFRGRRAMRRWLRHQVLAHLVHRLWVNSCAGTLNPRCPRAPAPCVCFTGIDAEECPALFANDICAAIKWPWLKPPAFLTIDDRAHCFDGDWSEIEPEAIAQFKPWYQRRTVPRQIQPLEGNHG